MNRDDFIDWLARLASDGVISEDEALGLLREFDGGAFQWDAPLPLRAAIQQENDPAAALALLLPFLRRRGVQGIGNLPPVTSAGRHRLLVGLQDAYKQQVRTLARNLSINGGAAQWQQGMNDLLAGQLNQSMLLAHGRTGLGAAELQRVQSVIAEQQAYLSRFADFLALAPQSEAYVAARSDLYGNSARSLYWRESELEFAGQGNGAGWLLRWVAHDDDRVCMNCVSMDGLYFSPGSTHPSPGDPGICFGRCRCRFDYVYDLALWGVMQVAPA